MQKIIFCLTADWEGEHFKNLNDFKGIRKYIGYNIPITHFISASYFTKPVKNAAEKILSALTAEDETALHVHCLRSLVKKAGVKFLDYPDFFEPFTPEVRTLVNLLPQKMRPRVTGRGVPISAYPSEDITKILALSEELVRHHLKQKKLIGFRAGGWMASDAVLQSLMQSGFMYDSSAAPPEILSKGYSENNPGNFRDEYNGKNGNFTKYILKLWGHQAQDEYFVSNKLSQEFCPDAYIKKTTQPYKIGTLTEMPNNAGVSDYASSVDTALFLTKKAIEEIKAGRQTPFFINLGFHQEGAIAYKMPVAEYFNSLSPEDREFIDFKTLSEAGKIAEKYLNSNKKCNI